MNRFVVLTFFLAIVLGGGLAIGFATRPGAWYAGLAKPAFNPPNRVFAPVWTLLYVMIAVAGWRIFLRAPADPAMIVWTIALVLNFLWSPVFFGAKRPDIATGSHGVADTMAKEPCGFHAAAEHALKLPGRNAFLTGAKQMNGLQPEPERQLGFLENGTHADSKGLAALVALAQTGAGGLALETANPRAIGIATVRANRAVRPKLGFDVLESSGFVMKAGV